MLWTGSTNHLGKMQGTAICVLRDLLPATEPIGDDEGFGCRASHRGQQNALTERL